MDHSTKVERSSKLIVMTIQTTVQSASRNIPPLCDDPFCNQLVTIRKHDEQNVKTNQQMELQLKYNFEKEMKKIHD
jgi:hypothetical protein